MLVRTLLFHKHLKASQSLCKNGWITLCHLEEIESLDPISMSLEEIKRRNDSVYSKDTESCYHHIIHLVLENNSVDVLENEQTFWNRKDQYLSVTKLHLQETTNITEQINALKSHFTEFNKEYPDVSWITYQTTELSDLVLVSTSKNFNQLSKWSLLATYSHLIGRTYTYFCVPHFLLSEDAKVNSHDSIDYLSLRFSIKNCKTAQTELEAVCDLMKGFFSSSPHRITGNEDVTLYVTNIPVRKVISLCKTWYEKNLRILDTFSEVVFRIGIACEKLGDDDTGNWKDSKLTEYCIALQHRMIETFKNTRCDSALKRPLTVLINALVYMSRSATLDEAVYQILPGLVAFWKNIEINNLQKCDEKLYLRSIELCVHMMEDLMRAEGQLSRQPEDRPIVYDIPIFFLECVTAFLQALNRLLIETDGYESNGHRFFLIPCAETEVSTVELFSVSKNAPGLLQIDIPFSWLYQPKRLLPALLHESAHYVGESCRLRTERFNLFLQCVCIEIVEYFFEPVVAGSREDLQAFVKDKFLVRKLNKDIEERTLYRICRDVIDIACELRDLQSFCILYRDYLIHHHGTARIIPPSQEELDSRFESFKFRISDLRVLFRETYADACMFYLIDPMAEDYLDFALDSNRNTLSTSTYLRTYIGLKASGHKFEEIVNAVAYHWRNNPAEYESAKDLLNELHSHIADGGNSSEVLLDKYIHNCYQAFCNSYTDTDKLDNIRSIYTEMISKKETFNHLKVLEIIDGSRQHILNWLKRIFV